MQFLNTQERLQSFHGLNSFPESRSIGSSPKDYKYETCTPSMSYRLNHYAGLVIAGCFFGTISTFSAVLRDNNISAFQQSFSRSFFALLYILVFFYYKKMRFLIDFKELKYYCLLGLVMSAIGFFENTAVSIGTPVAIVVLLLYTQPVWTTVFGKIFLKERIDSVKKVAVIISFCGIFLISKVWTISSINYGGFTLSLICGVLLSVEFIMIKELSLKPNHFLVSIFWFYIFRSVFTGVLGFISGIMTDNLIITGFTFSLSLEMWILLLLFAFIPMVLGMSLFYNSVKYVPIISVGVILLMEPLSGIVYGYVILGEGVGLFTVLGGGLILIASLLVVKR